VFFLACMNFGMSEEMATCCERLLTYGTEVLSFCKRCSRHGGEHGRGYRKLITEGGEVKKDCASNRSIEDTKR
jgi:hypothetical protein